MEVVSIKWGGRIVFERADALSSPVVDTGEELEGEAMDDVTTPAV